MGTEGQNHPLLFVDHRADGYKRTLDDDDWRHNNGVGVHFGIGRDGSIDQYTSIFDASWGNGVVGSKLKYDRTNRHLAAIEADATWITVQYGVGMAYALVRGSANAINTQTISTEHEDEGIDQPWTDAMVEADIRVKRWCIDEAARHGITLEVDDDLLAGHFQIDAVNRANCPGDNWPKQRILAGLQGGRMYTDAEIDAKIGEALKLGVRTQTNLNELANGIDAVSVANKWPLSLKGLWYVAGKAWPFGGDK